MLFFHQNNQIEAKTACFADFSILTKIAVSGPYRRGHFVGWFFWLIFWNVENTLPILLKHSKCCSFIKTIRLKQKKHVLRTFQFWPKSLYPDLTGVIILLVDFFGWVFQMLKIPFEFFWNIQNFVLSSKQSVWSKNSMFCGLFNFDQNRCIRTLPAWPFFWLIFLVEFFKCWKYPSNSSETFKILFFHQNNQFEAKTACFADFSILTKIAVSGPYRRGHFVGWFFWLSFSNVENTLPILLRHWKFCSFIKTISLKQKTGCFDVLLNFDQNRCIQTLPSVAIFRLIFWNVENTLPILLKHSKCCSFIKTIRLKQKQHVWLTFQFWPKSLYPDLTGVAILLVDFFGWFFEMLKIPFQFFWNIQNVVLSWKQSACFADFSILTKIAVSGTLPAWSFCWLIFLVEFFEMLKIPFEFFWNIENFVLSSKQSVWSKNSMFCGLFNFDQNRCIRTLPAWPFCSVDFLVENVENTLPILLKHSKFCSFIKTISLKQKQHVLRTFQFWPKSLYPDLTGVAIFLLLIFLSFSNVENTLPILLKHSKCCSFIKTISLKQKQHVLRTFQFWPKSLYPDLTGVAILLVDFFGWVFQMLKIPFEFFWNIQNFVLSSKQSVLKQKQACFCVLFNFWPKSLYPDLTSMAIFFGWFFWLSFSCWKYPSNSSETFKMCTFIKTIRFEAKTACFADFSILTEIAVSGPYRRCNFVSWIFWLSFSNVENTLRILLKHSKFLFFHQNNQFEAKTACFADFSILTKIAVSGPYRRGRGPSNSSETFKMLFFHQNNFLRSFQFWLMTHFHGWFFGWVFWNVENTLPILLKHSKCCSFIKTISLKQKQHVLRTFQFWRKSLYPDLTGVAILLVDFFGWVFQMLKIPFEFFWNIQNFVLSSKQSVWSKNSMFCGLFNFDQNRCIRTLPAWQFCWLIFLVDFLKCWKYPSNSSETFKILFFHQNNQFEAKTACFADFSILTKIAVSGPYRLGHFCWLIFLVEFFKCWKYPSNSSETFKILFFHQNNQFEAKTACFADFSILTKIAVSGPYRRGHFVSLFFLLSFSNVEKCPSNSSETFKILFFHQNNQFEAKTGCFAGLFNFDQKSLYPDLTDVAILLGWFFWLIFWNVENTLRILLKHSKFCSFIKTISLKQKQHVLRTFQFWPKSLYPDLTGVAIFVVDFF